MIIEKNKEYTYHGKKTTVKNIVGNKIYFTWLGGIIPTTLETFKKGLTLDHDLTEVTIAKQAEAKRIKKMTKPKMVSITQPTIQPIGGSTPILSMPEIIDNNVRSLTKKGVTKLIIILLIIIFVLFKKFRKVIKL